MATTPAPPFDPEQTRFVVPVAGPIVKATDLGSVQVLKQGNMYLLTDPFGDVQPGSRGLGLYEGDTRRLSCSILRVNGLRPVLLQASAGGNWRGTIQMTNPRIERNPRDKVRPEEALASQKLGIARTRTLTGTLLEERVRVVNYAEEAETVDVDLQLAADAADIFEIRGWSRAARGRHLPVALRGDRVTFRYDGVDGLRLATHVAFSEPALDAGPTDPDGSGPGAGWIRLAWRWHLASGEARELSWVAWTSSRRAAGGGGGAGKAVVGDGGGAGTVAEATVAGAATGRANRPADAGGGGGPDGGALAGSDAAPRRAAGTDVEPDGTLFPPVPRVGADAVEASYRAWGSGLASIRTDNELFNLVLERSAGDLRLLLNDGPGEGERYLAAGVPWFTTLFGRDAIIAACQALCVRPQLAIETLEVLASLQATEEDPGRDAEPGKILHELRTGEMARSGELPHRPYYGTVDATPLWLILLGATWDWTGDRALVDRLWPNALRALEWIDRYGDRDGDGFVEYERRTPAGLLNQGWKDSHDAIRDRAGRLAGTPIALAEVQGYVFDAKRRMGALARVRGEPDLAGRLEREAEALRVRFEDAFWSDEAGFYAMALDGDKRRADAIGSNPGHCLWTGIVSPARAQLVADRLLAPDMFSGWGVRTYAAGQPGYNPIGYHNGTVWPHDVSLIAAGLKRYDFHDEANLLVGRVFEASQHFPDFRLPELFCGFDRDGSAVPVPYPVACSPQAWAAGAMFLFAQTMLGLRPDAHRRELELRRPELPDWLGKVTVGNLRVGDDTVDLLVHRWRGGTSAEVLRKTPGLSVTIRM